MWCPLRGTPCCLGSQHGYTGHAALTRRWCTGCRCRSCHRGEVTAIHQPPQQRGSAYVRLGIGTTLSLAMQVWLAGGITWALPPSAGKCTRHAVGGQRAERTRATASEHFGHACPLVSVSAHQKKAAASGAPGTCCCCNRCAIRAPKWRRRSIAQLSPTDHMPKTLRPR